MQKVLLSLFLVVALAACQSNNVAMTTSAAQSRIASATTSAEGVTVVTLRGNRHTFGYNELCQGQSWMKVGDERFNLTQRGSVIFVDGFAVRGLNCPSWSSASGGGSYSGSNSGGESLERSQERSAEKDPGETSDGPTGETDSGEDTGIGAISG